MGRVPALAVLAAVVTAGAVLEVARPFGPVSSPGAATATADPIPANELLRQGHQITVIGPRSAPAGLVSQEAAIKEALRKVAQPGSTVMKAELAYVTNTPGGGTCLCYVAAIDPAGGIYAPGGALDARNTMFALNYDINFVDAKTGQWVLASQGIDPNLGTFPPITPSASG